MDAVKHHPRTPLLTYTVRKVPIALPLLALSAEDSGKGHHCESSGRHNLTSPTLFHCEALIMCASTLNVLYMIIRYQ
jgi:hypothetical protein